MQSVFEKLRNMHADHLVMVEALYLNVDNKSGMVYVHSDLPGKKGSAETYTNKEALKNAGFKWDTRLQRWFLITKSPEDLKTVQETIDLINAANGVVSVAGQTIKEIEKTPGDPSAKDELKNKIVNYIDELAASVSADELREKITNYFNFFSKFRKYSPFNRFMIYIHRPDATHVATISAWRKLERGIKKGSKGIPIFVPFFINKEDSPKPKKTNPRKPSDIKPEEEIPSKEPDPIEDGDTRVLFKIGYVFDIKDTYVYPGGVDKIPEEPKWWADETPSEIADQLYELVKQVATKEGINISNLAATGGEKGYAMAGHINISSGVEGVGRVSVMVHELAHALMHFKETSKFYQGDELCSNKELKELQAESVSYVVLKNYGFDVTHHATYLALWKANAQTIRKHLDSILEVSKYIIEEINKLGDKTNEQANIFTNYTKFTESIYNNNTKKQTHDHMKRFIFSFRQFNESSNADKITVESKAAHAESIQLESKVNDNRDEWWIEYEDENGEHGEVKRDTGGTKIFYDFDELLKTFNKLKADKEFTQGLVTMYSNSRKSNKDKSDIHYDFRTGKTERRNKLGKESKVTARPDRRK